MAFNNAKAERIHEFSEASFDEITLGAIGECAKKFTVAAHGSLIKLQKTVQKAPEPVDKAARLRDKLAAKEEENGVLEGRDLEGGGRPPRCLKSASRCTKKLPPTYMVTSGCNP